MNVITLGARLRKQTLKDWSQYERTCQDLGVEPTATHDEFLERNRNKLIVDYLEGQRTLNAMMERGIEEGLIEAKVSRTFAVTISPDETKIDFDTFYCLIQRLMKRKCFIDYTLSFEQRGTTEETLGQGFHVHIVAKMTQRGKQNVIADVYNTVKHCCEKQCVDVGLAKTPEKMIQNYLIDYKSDDGHKVETRDWDAKWRKKNGILPLYENEMPPRIVEESIA